MHDITQGWNYVHGQGRHCVNVPAILGVSDRSWQKLLHVPYLLTFRSMEMAMLQQTARWIVNTSQNKKYTE
jgi:hypothetical protein